MPGMEEDHPDQFFIQAFAQGRAKPPGENFSPFSGKMLM
jgi:hypothetical protein